MRLRVSVNTLSLFTFEAVAAGAAFRVAATRIAYVDFSQRAVIARAVVLAFGHAAADGGVHFLIVVFIHHKIPPFSPTKSILSDFSEKSMGKSSKDY